MACDICLRNLDAVFRGDLKYNSARNAAERAGCDRRCKNLTALDDKNVIGSAFGDIPRIVQHERLVRASQIRFNPRHYIVQVIK
jgi:hypothetical protein